VTNSPTYNPGACCTADCCFGNDEEPCWGDVEVVGEDWNEEDSTWIHACQGHLHMWEGGVYIAEVQGVALSV
jgi:hypothetical protein